MPASGYYEWVDTPEGKQPYYFTRRDGQAMTIAAIQDGWVDPTTREAVRSCTMVITEANKFVTEVHDRMPVILEATDFEQWERGDVKDAAALMKAAGEELVAPACSARARVFSFWGRWRRRSRIVAPLRSRTSRPRRSG
jgi:putative SOS response-associated peptidase YedK